MLLAAAVLLCPAPSVQALRCLGDGDRRRAPAKAPRGCSGAEGRPPPGAGRYAPVLALRAARSQQLVTEILAAVFEDLLGIPVRFLDLRDWPSDVAYRDLRDGCYDVDVEHRFMAEHVSGSSRAYREAMSASDAWAVDAGNIGYKVQAGVYYWPPSIRTTNAGTARTGPFYDWYRSYVEESYVKDTFPPLRAPHSIPLELRPCITKWNQHHPLPSNGSWCNSTGEFVPWYCREPNACGEVYSPPPELSMGSLEALIVAHRLPFKVVYLSQEDHRRLPAHGQPFLAYGEVPGAPVAGGESERVHFPDCGPVSEVNRGEGDSRTWPWGSAGCELPEAEPRKLMSKFLEHAEPLARVALGRIHFSQEDISYLLALDRNHSVDHAACTYFRERLMDFRLFAGHCGADTLTSEAATQCKCPPGHGWTYGGCNPCPEGFYSDSLSLLCDSCPEFSLSETGSRSPLSCKCQEGYYLASTSPGTCRECRRLAGGVGAVCPGDRLTSATASALHAEAPTWRGREGTPHRLPFAREGWVLFSKGAPDAPGGYQVWLVKCPVDGACLGMNQCAESMGGSVCHLCHPGHVRWAIGHICDHCDVAFSILWLAGFTLVSVTYMVFMASVMARQAVEHDQIITVIVRICIRFILVTSPVGKVVVEVPFLSRLTAPSDIPNTTWFALLCCMDLIGLRGAEFMYAGVYTTLIVLPSAVLFGSWLSFMAVKRRRRRRIERLQQQVDDISQLIRLCTSMEEIRMNKDDEKHMDTLQLEFKQHLSDVVYLSRVCGIWRAVSVRERWEPISTQSVRKQFLEDSMNLFIMLLTYIYPVVLPKVLSMLATLRIQNAPDGLEGWRMAMLPELEWMGPWHAGHFAVTSVLVSCFAVGLPIFIVRTIHRHRDHLAKEAVSSRIGFLYHGMQVQMPYCYGVLLELAQTLFVCTVMEGFISPEEEGVAYMFGGIMSLVLQSWYSPLEHQHHNVLHWLEFLLYLTWCCLGTAMVLLVQDSEAERERRLFTRLVCTGALVVYGLYWATACWQVWREVRRLVYRQITDFSGAASISAQSWGPWWTKIWICCRDRARDREDLPQMDLGAVEVEAVSEGRASLSSGSCDDVAICYPDPVAEQGTPIMMGQLSSWGYQDIPVRYDWLIRLLVGIARWESGFQQDCVHLEIRRRRVAAPKARGLDRVIKELVVHIGTEPESEEEEEGLQRSHTADFGRAHSTLARSRVLTPGTSSWDFRDSPGYSEGTEGPPGRRPTCCGRRCCSRTAEPSAGRVEPPVGVAGEPELLRSAASGRADVAALAGVLSEAIEVLLISHNMDGLPFCALEYVLVGAMCFMTRGHEWRQREALVNYVVHHPGGQAQGLVDLFNGMSWMPGAYCPKPVQYDLMSRFHAAAHGNYLVLGRRLTVRVLERYVLHLQTKSTEVVRSELEEYARLLLKAKEPPQAVECSSHFTQTWTRFEKGVQTEFQKSKGTCSDEFGLGLVQAEAPEATELEVTGRPSPVREQLFKLVQERRSQQEGIWVLKEQMAVAVQEAAMLKEELLLACSAPPPVAVPGPSEAAATAAQAAPAAASAIPAQSTGSVPPSRQKASGRKWHSPSTQSRFPEGVPDTETPVALAEAAAALSKPAARAASSLVPARWRRNSWCMRPSPSPKAKAQEVVFSPTMQAAPAPTVPAPTSAGSPVLAAPGVAPGGEQRISRHTWPVLSLKTKLQEAPMSAKGVMGEAQSGLHGTAYRAGLASDASDASPLNSASMGSHAKAVCDSEWSCITTNAGLLCVSSAMAHCKDTLRSGGDAGSSAGSEDCCYRHHGSGGDCPQPGSRHGASTKQSKARHRHHSKHQGDRRDLRVLEPLREELPPGVESNPAASHPRT